jgi:hypothetical protein
MKEEQGFLITYGSLRSLRLCVRLFLPIFRTNQIPVSTTIIPQTTTLRLSAFARVNLWKKYYKCLDA